MDFKKIIRVFSVVFLLVLLVFQVNSICIMDDHVPLSSGIKAIYYLNYRNEDNKTASYMHCKEIGIGTIQKAIIIRDNVDEVSKYLVSIPDYSSYVSSSEEMEWVTIYRSFGTYRVIGNAIPKTVTTQASGSVSNSTSSTTFDSTSDLISANLSANTYAYTKGFYTADDGGAAKYLISNKTSLTANGSTVLKMTNGLYAVLQTGTSVNLKQLGAKGDGSSDDSSYLITALSLGASEITFSKGTYNMNHVSISCSKALKLTGTSKDDCKLTNVNFTTPYGLSLSNLSFSKGTRKKVLTVASYVTGNVMFVTSPTGTTNISIDNCSFENTDCVSFAMNQNGQFKKDTVTNSTFNNIGMVAIYHSVNSTQSTFTNNTFTNIGSTSISSGFVSAIWLGDITNNTYVESQNVTISDNTFNTLNTADDFDANSKHVINANFIDVRADSATISGNTISNLNGYGHDREAIYTKVRNLTVKDNNITNGGQGEAYICCKGHSGNLTTIVDNNTVTGDSGCGIIVYGPATITNNNINITNAKSFINVASRDDLTNSESLLISGNTLTGGTSTSLQVGSTIISDYTTGAMINVYTNTTSATVSNNTLNPTTAFDRYIRFSNLLNDVSIDSNTINANNFSGVGIMVNISKNASYTTNSSISVSNNTVSLLEGATAVTVNLTQDDSLTTNRAISLTGNTLNFTTQNNSKSYAFKCYCLGANNNDTITVSGNTSNVSSNKLLIAYTGKTFQIDNDSFATVRAK